MENGKFFRGPLLLTVDKHRKRVIVTDLMQVHILDLDANVLHRFEPDHEILDCINGVDVDGSGRIFLREGFSSSFQLFDQEGNYLSEFPCFDDRHQELTPYNFCISQEHDKVFVTRISSRSVYVYSLQAELLCVIGRGMFREIKEIFCSRNRFYLRAKDKISAFDMDGKFIKRLDGTFVTQSEYFDSRFAMFIFDDDDEEETVLTGSFGMFTLKEGNHICSRSLASVFDSKISGVYVFEGRIFVSCVDPYFLVLK
jgi:hypothetical protein